MIRLLWFVLVCPLMAQTKLAPDQVARLQGQISSGSWNIQYIVRSAAGPIVIWNRQGGVAIDQVAGVDEVQFIETPYLATRANPWTAPVSGIRFLWLNFCTFGLGPRVVEVNGVQVPVVEHAPNWLEIPRLNRGDRVAVYYQ